MVPAVIATGLDKLSSCQPLAVSLAKVPVASKVPLDVHRVPTWLPVLSDSGTAPR